MAGRTQLWLGLAITIVGMANGAMAEEALPVDPIAPMSIEKPLDVLPDEIRGEVKFEPVPGELQIVPAPFRLEAHTFNFVQQPVDDISDVIRLSTVLFPSPVTTPVAVNNTVHCEYFRPAAPGKYPGCIVLHILGGDFELSRMFCRSLAHRGVAALFVKMPYYGPRRDPASATRMISLDPEQTVRGMTQAVLDIRRAGAWLGSQPEVDSSQLGIFGISLGGITGGLAAAAEPRFGKVCLLLAGGDIARLTWESKELADVRRRYTEAGGTRERLVELLKVVDPVTYGPLLQGRKIFMMNADDDEIIPKVCTESMWEAFGKPTIKWFAAGHKTAALHIFEALGSVTDFFQPAKKS